MKEEKIEIKKLNNNAIIPTYGSIDAAGADLYACIDNSETILPHETKLIKTGLAIAIPKGLVGLVFARSGLASKRGLAPANKVGVIDADYRGEIMVALHNHTITSQTMAAKPFQPTPPRKMTLSTSVLHCLPPRSTTAS